MRTELCAAGVDVDGTLNRFMNNEALLTKFLKKFIADQNMAALRKAIAARNYQEVLPAAHTLKGVCGNLGFTALYDIFSKMCQACRSEQFDGLDGLMAQAESHYGQIIKVIAAI